jgi:hypothetical protein
MDSEVVGSPESTGPWYRDITASQWRVLVAAWGVWVNDALDFFWRSRSSLATLHADAAFAGSAALHSAD